MEYLVNVRIIVVLCIVVCTLSKGVTTTKKEFRITTFFFIKSDKEYEGEGEIKLWALNL